MPVGLRELRAGFGSGNLVSASLDIGESNSTD